MDQVGRLFDVKLTEQQVRILKELTDDEVARIDAIETKNMTPAEFIALEVRAHYLVLASDTFYFCEQEEAPSNDSDG
jgi:vacuolar-type H+-ATPase subunit B/Vma2